MAVAAAFSVGCISSAHRDAAGVYFHDADYRLSKPCITGTLIYLDEILNWRN
jgi:hypothetical protein